MEQVPFQACAERGLLFTDGHSLARLCSAWPLITEAFPECFDAHGVLASIRDDGGYRSAIDLLARIVVYEGLAADQAVLDALATNGVIDLGMLASVPAIRAARLETSDYAAADAAVGRVVSRELAREGSLVCSMLRRPDEWFDPCDKIAHDALFKEQPRHFWASSDESVERLLFYLELARIGRLPVLVSPVKQEFLAALQGAGKTDALSQVETIVDDALRQVAGERLRDAFPPALEAPLPPLAELITRRACRKGLSLLDAAMEIRDEDAAVVFRRWLWSVQESLVRGDPADRLWRAQEFREISELVADWAARGGVRVGTTHRVLRGSLAGVPCVGWILDILGVAEFELTFRQPAAAKRHVHFIADWFATGA